MSIFNFFKKSEKEVFSTGMTSTELFKEDVDKREYDRENRKLGTCVCEVCDSKYKDVCQINTYKNRYLKEVLKTIDIDESKETILLLDDNTGVLSFLMDDLKILRKKKLFDYKKYNILTFDSKLAGFKLRATLLSQQPLNIKFAIFDITLGGTLFSDDGENISLDGVDCYIDVAKEYPDTKYIFYTGNKLNPYIKKNEQIIKKFNDFTNDDIKSHVLFKTTLNREQRQEYLLKFFTEE